MDTVDILYMSFGFLVGWVAWQIGRDSWETRNRRVAGERQDQAYIEYSKAEREHMRGPRYDLIIHDEVAYMQDVQEEKQYDILGWTKKPLHDCDDSLIDDCGPDCE